VGVERDAALLALALNNPKLPAIGWYRDGNCRGHLG
jgi:hypothetical protein